MCLGMCTGLLSLFQLRLNYQGHLGPELGRSAYAAYLIHEPVITFMTIWATGVMVYPLLKFVLATLIFTPVCFTIGILLRRVPYFDRVL